jgi:hypothetical protein
MGSAGQTVPDISKCLISTKRFLSESDCPRRAIQQSLAADGAIACFSSKQLKAGVSWLRVLQEYVMAKVSNVYVLLLGLLSVSVPLVSMGNSPATPFSAIDNFACNQSMRQRNALMSEAERNTFTVRRVEFIGLTYTHDQIVRDRMTPLVQEGDIFSREKLVKSLQNMSRLRTINPLRWRDVVIQLNKSEKSVDMIICFKQKPRSKTSSSRPAERSGR